MDLDTRYSIINLEIINGLLEINNDTHTYFLANAVSEFENRIRTNLQYIPYIKKINPSFICITFHKKPELNILFQNCHLTYIINIENRLNEFLLELDKLDIVFR